MAKYTVQEAIWIATALMAEEVYSKNPNADREDMYFKQADIARRAKKYTDGKVDAARISQWLNADHKDHTHNYLKGDSLVAPLARRLSKLDEFSEKTCPDMSKWDM